MPRLAIYIESDDQSDLDWIRERALGAVQNEVDENEARFDAEVTVGWDYLDD